MKSIVFAGLAFLTAGFTGLLAQQPAQQAAAPAEKTGPKAKSQAELKALQALQSAPDPDGQIKAAEDLLSKYADTDFKEWALTIEANAYRNKNDNVNAQVVAERVLEVNPHAYMMENLVGTLIVTHIGEHDLNRAEEVAKCEKLFNGAIADVMAATKPNPTITDEQWTANQKYTVAEAHNGLGILAQIDKHWDVAAKEYQLAVDNDPEQDAYGTRLANAYVMIGKKAEAAALCDKLLAKPNLHPTIKQMVTQIKAQATK